MEESVSVDAVVEGVPLTVAKVCCVRVADGPELWTFVDVEVAADRAARLAGALSRVREREGGRSCDFWSGDEGAVVFCDRVLPRRSGDRGPVSRRGRRAVYGSPAIPPRLAPIADLNHGHRRDHDAGSSSHEPGFT